MVSITPIKYSQAINYNFKYSRHLLFNVLMELTK